MNRDEEFPEAHLANNLSDVRLSRQNFFVDSLLTCLRVRSLKIQSNKLCLNGLNISLKVRACVTVLFFLVFSHLAVSQNSNLQLHTVVSNETLYAIAQRYETTVETLVSTNQLKNQTIYVGQRLYVPDSIRAQSQNSQSQNNASAVTVESQGFYVTIAEGESLLALALRYGVAIGELARINNIKDVTKIPAGSAIYIPAAQVQAVQAVQGSSSPVATPVAEQLQTSPQSSGEQNIQIVATRHQIGSTPVGSTPVGSTPVGSTPVGSTPATPVTVYPNGPRVSIGVATSSVPNSLPNSVSSAQSSTSLSPSSSSGLSQRLQPIQPVQPVAQAPASESASQSIVQSVDQSVDQSVGGFVPEDQSPKEKLLQQQLALLRQSGPQLSNFQIPLQEFAWPLDIKGRISSNYGSRKLAITSNRFHYGLDIAAVTGTVVKSAKAGVVKEAAWIGGYGNAVYIDHPDGTQTRYAHMNSLSVEEGDSVAQGDVLGKVGSTGVSTGPHLHFEIRVAGYAVDPLEYISQP